MNEKLDIVKSEYKAMQDLKGIWNNPMVQFIISNIPCISTISTIVDGSIQYLIDERQKKKMEELLETVFLDSSITLDDLYDVDHIMEFAKVMDVVNHLIRNDKVKYFGKLLKSTIHSGNKNIDEFEELLNKLNELSLREIDLLFLLAETEKNHIIKDSNNNDTIDYTKSWKDFVEKVKDEYDMNETEIDSSMLGIMRTGFCMSDWNFSFSKAGLVMYTTPSYKILLDKIY